MEKQRGSARGGKGVVLVVKMSLLELTLVQTGVLLGAMCVSPAE